MPKHFTEDERQVIKEKLLQGAARLMRQKSLRRVTVEDVTSATQIAKGSFYSFYDSREALFWDVIKREEDQLLEKIFRATQSDMATQDKIEHIFRAYYLAQDSLVFALSDEDIAHLKRKLPSSVMDEDKKKGQSVVSAIFDLAGYEPDENVVDRVLSMLNTLRSVATDRSFRSESARKQMIDLLIKTFSEHLTEERGSKNNE